MNLDFEARLEADGVAFEDRDAELLRAVAAEESLNAAAERLGRSYSRAQRRVVELEEAFGPLVERSRGGAGGGGSRLTDEAEGLLARFERARAEFAGVAEADEMVLDGRVVERDGELGVVETPAGRVLAVVPEGADAVEVVVRSDAVVLHDPGEAPAAAATSARNRFTGTVDTVERGASVAAVAVDVGAETPLAALVTRRSVSKLALEPGDEVVASFKSTATRAVPGEASMDT
jgi:molybdate transport system regulatory protein